MLFGLIYEDLGASAELPQLREAILIGQETRDHPLVDLEMELQTIGIFPVTESLALTHLRARQVGGAIGDVERIPMHLEYIFLRL